MIAVDTSTLTAFLAGDSGGDVEAFDRALAGNEATLPPAVVAETLSAGNLTADVERLILSLPRLGLVEGYWERVGHLRRTLLARRLRAPLADALICQSCLDHDVPLATRDRDFDRFAKHCGLELV